MNTNTTDPVLTAPPPEAAPLTTTGRYLILTVAFLGWLWAGVLMSITQLTGQSAAIDLLGRVGDLDVARFQTLRNQAQVKEAAGARPPALSESERTELQQGETLVSRWWAWYQCAFLFGAAAGGLVFGRVG